MNASSADNSLLSRVCQWRNLLLAFRNAARGKRGKMSTARFEARLADELIQLQAELEDGSYQPGGYRHFSIHEPKRRRISAAPFRDRVIHHALCQIIEPFFERSFINDSYANRVGKGSHRAIARCQQFSRRYRYVLQCDIVQHFAAIDHAILFCILQQRLPDSSLDSLIKCIISSGTGVLEQSYTMHWFDGDDLLAACRPRGLPIGNLTSQFWSNCYLDPFDHFVKRQLRCPAYVRYVDDFVLFGHDKAQLWQWKQAIIQRLARYRLTVHENSCQVSPTRCGIPWLGFVIYPEKRLLRARKARYATRHLRQRQQDWREGRISYAEFHASVQGWVNHSSHADSWGLRRTVFRRLAER
jgi:hypothetical protein